MSKHIEILQKKLESNAIPSAPEIAEAKSEVLLIKEKPESRSALLLLRDAIEKKAPSMEDSGGAREQLEDLKSLLPVRSTLEQAGATASAFATDALEKSKETGMEVGAEALEYGRGFAEKLGKGEVRQAVTEHPYIAGILLWTGLAWLGDRTASFADGKERPSFFGRLMRTALTFTGISFLARLIQKYAKPIPYDEGPMNTTSPADQPSGSAAIDPFEVPEKSPEAPVGGQKVAVPPAVLPTDAAPNASKVEPVQPESKKPTPKDPPLSPEKKTTPDAPKKPEQVGPQKIDGTPRSITVEGKPYTVALRNGALQVNGNAWKLQGMGSAYFATLSMTRASWDVSKGLALTVNVDAPGSGNDGDISQQILPKEVSSIAAKLAAGTAPEPFEATSKGTKYKIKFVAA